MEFRYRTGGGEGSVARLKSTFALASGGTVRSRTYSTEDFIICFDYGRRWTGRRGFAGGFGRPERCTSHITCTIALATSTIQT